MTSTPGPLWLSALRFSGSVGSSVSFWIDRYAVLPSAGEVDERAAVDVLEQLVALRRVVAREELRLGGVGDVEEQHAALRIGDRDRGDVGLDVHLAEDHVRAVLAAARSATRRRPAPCGRRTSCCGDVVVAVALADRHRLRRLLGARAGGRAAPGAAWRSAYSAAAASACAPPARPPNSPWPPSAPGRGAVRLAGVRAAGAVASAPAPAASSGEARQREAAAHAAAKLPRSAAAVAVASASPGAR